MRRKHVERLERYLRDEGGKATYLAIETVFGWDKDKVNKLLKESDGGLKKRKNVVYQIRNEIGRRGAVPLYKDARRVLSKTWANSKKMQCAAALDTSLAGRAKTGTWSRPDCVLVSYPARRASLSQPPHLSTFEIEGRGSFSVESVYQAHSHGWGADYSWVLFVRSETDKSDGNSPEPDWDRIVWVAKACGVGLISCTKPNNYKTWIEHIPAKRRADNRRKEFVEQAIPTNYREYAHRSLENLPKL